MRLKFKPQENITVWELAVICSKCSPSGYVYFTPDQWRDLDEMLKRHFTSSAW